MISISAVSLGEEEAALVLEVLRSGQLVQGRFVERFEDECRVMAGTSHAVAVNNGTTALVLALEVLRLEPGDEVITSPLTFVATLNAALEAGATVRFADVGDDFNINPDSVAALVGPRSKVLLPVHLYGQPADLKALTRIASEHGLHLVEDAAQAHGADVDGKRVGSWGIGCFSFYATKNITTGEGGVVTTNDDVLADRMRLLRNQGMRARYDYEIPGHNYRMTDLAAAVALPQFKRLERINEVRRSNAAHLSVGLNDVKGLVTPKEAADRRSVWHQYTVQITADANVTRDEFIRALAEAEIGTAIYYPRAVYDYACYRDHPRVMVDGSPVAEALAARVVSLPVHPGVSRRELDHIVATIRSVLA